MRRTWLGAVAAVLIAALAAVAIIAQFAKPQPAATAKLPSVRVEPKPTPSIADLVTVVKSLDPTPRPDVPANVPDRIAQLEARRRDEPANKEVLTELAGLYLLTRLYPKAADTFSAALDLDPNNPNLHSNLAASYLYQGQLDMARKQYQLAVAADPSLPDPHFNLAVILSHSEPPDIASALVEWREVIRLAPDSELAAKSRDYIAKYEPKEG